MSTDRMYTYTQTRVLLHYLQTNILGIRGGTSAAIIKRR